MEPLAPLKQRTLKDGKKKPNLCPEVLKKLHEKKELRTKLQETMAVGKMDYNLLEAYKKCRNQCSNMIKSSHRKQQGTNITEATSINDVWKIVNSILTQRESAKLIIQVKGPIKGKYEDPELVSNELNNWFKEKVEGLVIKIDKTRLKDPFSKITRKLENRNLKFTLQPVDVIQVLTVLKNLKKKDKLWFGRHFI